MSNSRYDRDMVQVHMTEAEVASNFAAALEKVRQGLEVVVEHDHQAIAVLKPAEPPRRKISECIAMLPADSTSPGPQQPPLPITKNNPITA